MRKNLFLTGAGILLLITTAMIYIPKFRNQGLQGIELTFISNFITGLFLLLDGCLAIGRKKSLPQTWHLAADSVLLCVLLISLFCIGEARFDGPFLFLHLLNPVIATVLVILYTYQKPLRILPTGLGTLVIASLYFVYVIIYGYRSGDWLYSMINVPEKGIVYVIFFYLIAAAALLVMEYAVYHGSKWIYERKK